LKCNGRFEVDSNHSGKALRATAAEPDPQLPPWALTNQPLFPSGLPARKVDENLPVAESSAPVNVPGVEAAPADSSENLRLKARCWDQRCA